MKYRVMCGITAVLLLLLLLLLLIPRFAWSPRAADAKAACAPLQRIPTEDGDVWIVSNDCKEGLPHTTDAHTICMPVSAWADTARRPITLTHERVHLAQKRALQDWYAFYARAWDYVVSPKTGMPSMHAPGTMW